METDGPDPDPIPPTRRVRVDPVNVLGLLLTEECKTGPPEGEDKVDSGPG